MSTTSDRYVPFYVAVFGKSNDGPPDKNLLFETPVVEESKDSDNHDILSPFKENDIPRNGCRRVILPTPEKSTTTSPPNSRSTVPSLLSLDIQRPKAILPKEPRISKNILPNKNIPPPSLLPKGHYSSVNGKNFPKKLKRSGNVSNNSNEKLWSNNRRANNDSSPPKSLITPPMTNTNIQNHYVREVSSFYFNNTIQGTSISIYQQKDKNSRLYGHNKNNMSHPNIKNGTNSEVIKQGMIKKKGISRKCSNHNGINNGKFVNHKRTTNVFKMYKKNCNSTPNVQCFNKERDHTSFGVELKPDKIPPSNRKPLLPAPFTNQQ
uniref:Uncharacterized protein n=1 Tax=Strongyloides papillosus TaxID=174720 RepID=A0A0N5BUY3_STREA